jgi:hypothetical protein
VFWRCCVCVVCSVFLLWLLSQLAFMGEGLAQQGLNGAERRSGLPIAGAFYDLAHATEPDAGLAMASAVGGFGAARLLDFRMKNFGFRLGFAAEQTVLEVKTERNRADSAKRLHRRKDAEGQRGRGGLPLKSGFHCGVLLPEASGSCALPWLEGV